MMGEISEMKARAKANARRERQLRFHDIKIEACMSIDRLNGQQRWRGIKAVSRSLLGGGLLYRQTVNR